MKTQLLVVEDNEDLLELMTRQLHFLGFQVTAAKNGMEAVAMALSEQPNVILMDIVMPKMDGFEAVSQIRANPKTREIPVLAVTAWVTPNSRQRYLASGFNDYIAKPFTHKDLLRAIGQLLRDTDKRSDAREPTPLSTDRPN
jgi:two-component system cell cycle response regulator DivK